MTLDEAVDQMKTILGFRTDLATKGPTELGKAQNYFERQPVHPWFILSENSTILTNLSDRRVTLPTGFIDEYEDGALYYDPQDGSDIIPLEKADYDQLVFDVGTEAEGVPAFYSIDGLYFNIFPYSTTDRYQLQMKYYKQDSPISGLSGSQTNQWLTYAPECLIARAGLILATGYRDNVALARFAAMEQEARQLLNIQNDDRKYTNRSLQVGGHHV